MAVDPISTAISLGMPLIQAGIGAIGMKKAKDEHQKSYDELMAQDYGATASAKNYLKNPISADLLDRMFSQIDRTTGSGISALQKGGTRSLGQVGNVMNEAMDAGTKIGEMGQRYYADAIGLNANQEMAGRQQKQSYMAQNTAGLAQREMEKRMAVNSGLQGFAQNAMTLGLEGAFKSKEPVDTTMDTSGMDRFKTEESQGGNQIQFNQDPNNPYGRGLDGGFNMNGNLFDFTPPQFGNFLNMGFPNK